MLVVARLVDGTDEQHLIVDPFGEPRCVIGRPVSLESACGAVPNLLLHEGFELRLTARAAVRLFCLGEFFGLPKETACELGRYQGPGQRAAVMLLAEGTEISVVGWPVAEAGLELLPGDRVRERG